METITVQYDATNPALRGLMAAFLKLDGVKKVATKTKETEKKRFLDELKEAGREAKQLARKRTSTRTLDDIIAEL